MASAILSAAVLAVTWAITAGQQHAYEAQQRIAATLAAEQLIGEILRDDYGQLKANWHGAIDMPGSLPDPFEMIGRTAMVSDPIIETLPLPNVDVRGRTVTVQAFDPRWRTLAEIAHFVPEPSS